MLADIRGRAQNLRLADIVVLNENDLEEIADILVVIDNGTDLVDEVDDRLRHPVSWSGFATEDGDSGGHFLALFRLHGFDGEIAVDALEDIQLLAFILMYTLNLDIEEGMGVKYDASGRLDVLG